MISEAVTDVSNNNQIEVTNNIKIKLVCFFTIILLFKHKILVVFAEDISYLIPLKIKIESIIVI